MDIGIYIIQKRNVYKDHMRIYLYRYKEVKKMNDYHWILEELGPERLQRIARYVEGVEREKHVNSYPEKISGGQERLIKLQLKAFERIPGEIIAEYMNKEEREEYEVLRYAYS